MVKEDPPLRLLLWTGMTLNGARAKRHRVKAVLLSRVRQRKQPLQEFRLWVKGGTFGERLAKEGSPFGFKRFGGRRVTIHGVCVKHHRVNMVGEGPAGQAGYGRLDQVACHSRKRPRHRTLGAGAAILALASSACRDARYREQSFRSRR